jgi:hypothetical protein
MMMKRTIAVASTCAVLGGASVGLAATRQSASKAIVLLPGQSITYSGLTCTTYPASTPSKANIVCVRNNLAGFGVVVSQQSIIVAKQTGAKVEVVFKTRNK